MDKGTILIIDDSPTNIKLIVDYLSEKGFRILVAKNGESGIKITKMTNPDLILLDIMMPEMDGFKTCDVIKKEVNKDIPILFMTALSELESKIRCFETGGADYITKPFQYEEVIARITTHLSIRQLQKELQNYNEKLENQVQERTVELQRTLKEVETIKQRLQDENIYLREIITLAKEKKSVSLEEE